MTLLQARKLAGLAGPTPVVTCGVLLTVACAVISACGPAASTIPTGRELSAPGQSQPERTAGAAMSKTTPDSSPPTVPAQTGELRPVSTLAAARHSGADGSLQARLDDLFRRLQQESVPAEVFPARYVRTEGLLEAGQRRADWMLASCLAEYWLGESRVSRLELTLWKGSRAENSGAIRLDWEEVWQAAENVVREYRRRPYEVVAKAAATATVDVRPEDTVESALGRAVADVIRQTGAPQSAGMVVHARTRLRPKLLAAFQEQTEERTAARQATLEVLKRNADGRLTAEQLKMAEAAFSAGESELQALARTVKLEGSVEELFLRSQAAPRSPCDWTPAGQDLLLLAAAELHHIGVPAESLDDRDLGTAFLASAGRLKEIKQVLETSLEREMIVKLADVEARMLVVGKSVRTATDAQRAAFADPQGFDSLLPYDAARLWREEVVKEVREELTRNVRRRVTGTLQEEQLVEETEAVLAQSLDELWLNAAVEAMKARLTRVSKLTAADLGDLTDFRSPSGANLQVQVRGKLEDSLRRSGWSDQCLKNHFISAALNVRSQQLAELVKRISSNEGV